MPEPATRCHCSPTVSGCAGCWLAALTGVGCWVLGLRERSPTPNTQRPTPGAAPRPDPCTAAVVSAASNSRIAPAIRCLRPNWRSQEGSAFSLDAMLSTPLCRTGSAISYQLSAISYQLSAISYQLSAISYQLF